MTAKHTILQLENGQTLVDYGPMRLFIQAWKGGQNLAEAGLAAGHQSLGYLERVAVHRDLLSRPAHRIERPPADALAKKMVESAQRIGDADLTPMATVAGTIADFVADWLVEQEATKVIVNNGGDIAIRLGPGETLTVGLRTDIETSEITHRLQLDSRRDSWGVTTSGLGGRSLTRGIASGVTALARDASIADAAATAIANACYIQTEAVRQVPAEQLDPGTDLGGIPVTVAVGSLTAGERTAAMAHALDKAEFLVRKEVIVGAVIASGHRVVSTDDMRHYVISYRNRPE